MPWSFLRPKRPDWFVRWLIGSFVSVVIYLVAGWRTPWLPGRFWGLTFGTLASLIFLFEGLYPVRRRLLAWPFGTAQRWLQLHIYGGALGSLFVLIHMGFRWPGGQFGWWLFVLTLWSTATGLLGIWLQKWLPTVLTSQLSVEAIQSRIPEMTARLQAEADKLMQGASETLQRFYGGIRPSLANVTQSWSYLVDVRADRERRLSAFRTIAPFVADAERERLDDLQAIVVEKAELDVHYTLQIALRFWLYLHVPPSMLLLGLIAAHIVMVWYL